MNLGNVKRYQPISVFPGLIAGGVIAAVWEFVWLYRTHWWDSGNTWIDLFRIGAIALIGIAWAAIPILGILLTGLFILNSFQAGAIHSRRQHSELWHALWKRRRIIQAGAVGVFLVITAAMILFFSHRFHDAGMIAWSLFILIGTLMWITVGFILIVETGRRPGRSFLLPGGILLIAVLINLRWLSFVVDLPAVAVAAGWAALSMAGVRMHAGIPFDHRTRIWMIVVPMMIACICFPCLLAWERAGIPMIRSHTTLIKYPVRAILASGLLSALPIPPAPPPTAKSRPTPVSPDRFDHEQWNHENRQDYAYRPRPSTTEIGDPTRWNVILLTIDSLRADHVSCYGYAEETTPHIDQLARAGVLFERHYTQGGDSIFSLNSIMSGVLPWRKRNHADPMFGALVSQAGIATAYVGYDDVLKGGAFRDGFDRMELLEGTREDIWRSTTSEHIVDRMIAVINSMKDHRFFLYSHLLDPHADYVNTIDTHRFASSAHARYDGEIAFTDRHIGRLVEFLRRENLFMRTVIIITADHGEAFGEHGNLWHGRYLYDESVRTPLIMTLPGLSNRRVAIPVGPVNIAPTILDFWGIPIPCGMDGHSLLPLIYSGDVRGLPKVKMVIPNE
ncbi:sulfatase, partial [bacterium]|nr:sulfatase [candidate division CSSED10-310 bacterium]